MTLAYMLNMGEDELICDLAETYGILNYEELSPSLVATLSVGLRDNSRIKMKITGHKLSLEQMLMSLMVDNLQFIAWSKTKSATKNQNKPESVFRRLMDMDDSKNKDELMSFETPEEFDAYMESRRKG